jgi:hypothetical protein
MGLDIPHEAWLASIGLAVRPLTPANSGGVTIDTVAVDGVETYVAFHFERTARFANGIDVRLIPERGAQIETSGGSCLVDPVRGQGKHGSQTWYCLAVGDPIPDRSATVRLRASEVVVGKAPSVRVQYRQLYELTFHLDPRAYRLRHVVTLLATAGDPSNQLSLLELDLWPAFSILVARLTGQAIAVPHAYMNSREAEHLDYFPDGEDSQIGSGHDVLYTDVQAWETQPLHPGERATFSIPHLEGYTNYGGGDWSTSLGQPYVAPGPGSVTFTVPR